MADPPSHPDRSDEQLSKVDGSPRRYRRSVLAAWTAGAVVVATMIVLHLAGVTPH
jgi:hypothetical protein